jgi:hypothetical protein
LPVRSAFSKISLRCGQVLFFEWWNRASKWAESLTEGVSCGAAEVGGQLREQGADPLSQNVSPLFAKRQRTVPAKRHSLFS